MSTTAVHVRLRETAKSFRKKHPDYEAWLESWMPAWRRRLSRSALRRMSGNEFAEILVDLQERWSRLARLKGRLASPVNWPKTRDALLILADERCALAERLDKVRPPDGTLPVPHLGQAVITAFLHLNRPHRYAVWNGKSENGMKYFGLWPEFPRGATFAEKYLLINAVACRCSRATQIPLPLLDHLWWFATQDWEGPLFRLEDAAGLEGGARELQSRTKRDRGIINKAKILWSDGGLTSPACVVCGWSMADIYGDAGFGFIEAHHHEPFANSDKERITRIEDLSPVCPNCHAILHLSEMTIDDLSQVLDERGMAR